MSYSNGPTIVTDGLVLALDAGDRNSYPGSGTTWSDLAGSNNGTLTNGPTFDSGNGGSIVFDGSNDYGITPNYNKDSNLSLSVFAWVKLVQQPNIYLNRYYLNWIVNKRDDSNDKQWQLLFRKDTNGDNKTYVAINLYNGSNIICSINEGSSWKLYINGNVEYTNTVTREFPSTTTNMRIGSWNHSTAREFNGDIASFRAYHKTLTPQEILQNYNSTKGRFGL